MNGEEQTLIIDKALCTLNDYTNANRTNKYVGAKIKKNETLYCEICSRNQLKPVLSYPIDISIQWYQNGRKDPDNISFGVKFILDGMVKAGIIENDGQKQIRNISHSFIKSKIDKAEVKIMEV